MTTMTRSDITQLTANNNPAAVKGKADDLYRGSMQSEDHRRTALQPCSLDPMPLPTIRHF